MDTLKNVGNQVSETVQGATSTASKETNKSQSSSTTDAWHSPTDPSVSDVAKDSDAPVGSRAEAAKDAVGDKVDEQKHETLEVTHLLSQWPAAVELIIVLVDDLLQIGFARLTDRQAQHQLCSDDGRPRVLSRKHGKHGKRARHATQVHEVKHHEVGHIPVRTQ
ncbi:MAG: hypothetical protein L6R35_004518 [Caloplaca aegaea]|nr:MAG: hypothetical protein L6R35_004518 [Caloplaca aegaea]